MDDGQGLTLKLNSAKQSLTAAGTGRSLVKRGKRMKVNDEHFKKRIKMKSGSKKK